MIPQSLVRKKKLITTTDKPSYKIIGVNRNLVKVLGKASLYLTYEPNRKSGAGLWVTQVTVRL